MKSYRLRSFVYSAIKVLVSLLLAFAIGGIVLSIAGFDPLQAYRLIVIGAFGNVNNFLTSLYYATPLIITGLAFLFAQHAGILNLGAEGQLYIGALVAGLLGAYVSPMPSILHIPLVLIGSCIAAGLFGMVIGLLKVKFNANEVIVAFMMNSILISFTSYIVNYPLLDEQQLPRTKRIAATAQLGKIFSNHYISYATVMAIVAVIIVWLVLKYSRFGFRMHLMRSGRECAEAAGVPIDKMIVLTFFISGMIAGLCGAGQVMGSTYRFSDGFSSGYGFEGIAVVALAGSNPLSIFLAALFWGGLSAGAATVNRIATIPMDIVSLIQAIVVILMAAPKCMDTICAPVRRLLLKEENQHE